VVDIIIVILLDLGIQEVEKIYGASVFLLN
jgi:hypothetical protein